MSEFTAVAERESIVAKWVAGSPESQEVMLLADDGEGTYLSGNVRYDESQQEYPWQVSFFSEEEGMTFDEQSFKSREEAMLATEEYFNLAGYNPDRLSRADALIGLDEKLTGGKIDRSDAFALARVALRSAQGLYNVRTGTVLMPSVDLERGRVMGIYRTEVKLSDIIDPKTAEVTRNAWKHASFYDSDRWHDGEIGFCPVSGEREAANYILRAMENNGSGWCFADELSIEAKVGLVPDKYVTVQYRPDNLESDEEPLGWADFLEAAEGNASYAMSLVNQCDWQFPSTLADEDERTGEVARIGGKLFVTYGHDLEDFGKQHEGIDSLDDKRNDAQDIAEALASVHHVPHLSMREGDAI